METPTNPEILNSETNENKKKLADLDLQQLKVNEAFSQNQITESEKDERESKINAHARKLRRRNFEIYLQTNNLMQIEDEIRENILASLETFGEEMPIFVEQVVDDTFAIELDNEVLTEPVQEIIETLKKEYDLLSFDE